MKRLFSLFLICILLLSTVPEGVNLAFALEGSGTASAPYIITTAEELLEISDGGFYKLGADLTVTAPITGKGGFTLDGNNHKLTLNIAGDGLFSTLSGNTTIKNLVLDGSVTGSTADGTAALIGHTVATSEITLENIINYASVTAPSYYIGSLVGRMYDGTMNINGCENHGNIGTLTTGNRSYVGGFIGLAYMGTINFTSTYNYGKVSGEEGFYIAGFVPVHGNATAALEINITNCGNYGEIYGDHMGGFVTFSDSMQDAKKVNIKNSFNAGKIQNQKNNTTQQSVFVQKKTATGTVPVVTIENCFNYGTVGHIASGTYTTSGNFTSFGTVKNSYNAGNLTNFNRGGTTENCYYLEGSATDNLQTATLLTDDALKGGLPTGFSTDNWEYVTNSEASENYSYPQLKSNRIYFGYKTILKDTNAYNIPSYSLTKGTISGVDSKPFKYEELMSSSEYSVISSLGTYKGLGQTDIVYGNSFSINKSAVIYIASKDSAINSQGFTPVLSTDGNNNAFVYDKYGTKYYLSSKTIAVENGTSDIETPSGTLGVFVGWLDNVKVTTAPSQNGKIFLDDTEITSTSEKTFIKGQEIKLTVIPTSGYYLKALNVNSTLHTENIIEETDIYLTLDKDISVTSEFVKYQPELKFEVLRETNGSGTIDQKVKLSGDAYEFMAGKVISLEIKNSQNTQVLTESTTVSGDGKFEIVKLFTYSSDNYIINAIINNLTFLIEDDSNSGTYYIPTVTAINNLLTSLNSDTTLIDKTTLKEDIETDKDLNFDVAVYKNLSTLKIDIVTRFLAYNDGLYSVDNIPERFATSVILSVMNNGTSDQIKSVAEYYETDYLKLKDETSYYADFETLNASDVYTLMTYCDYASLSDVNVNFKNSVVIGLIKNTFNSGNILPILIKYKTDLNIADITTIDNYTDYRQRKAMEYLDANKTSINTYEKLKETLEYITTNIDTIAPTVILPPPSSGGGGGSSVTVSGGGGGSSQPSVIGKAEDVTSKYGDITNDEETIKPTGEVIYYNDFSEETVGESPMTVAVAGSAGSAIVTEDKEKGKCIKIINTTEGYENQDISQTIATDDSPIAFETEFQWLSGQDNVGIYILLNNQNESVFNMFTNTANSTLSFNNQSGTAQAFPGSGIPLKKGVWYKVRIVVDTINKTVNFSVKSDAYKNINTNSLSKSYTYDNASNTVSTGTIALKGDNIEPVSKFIFRTTRYKSEFLVSYIKIEKNPTDLIGKTEIKAPDAPTVPDPVPHAVAGEINIKLNGKFVYSYIKPIMVNDRVLVSVRNILEMFKMDVTWDEATETVTAKDENNIVILKNNDVNITVNGEVKTTDVPAQLYGDRIYVPLRFLSECFGMAVDWEQETQTVIIEGGSIND